MVALKDIAKAAGVSVGTASRILNQGRAHLYSPETRRRVIEVSRKFGYRPNRAAQAMRLQKTRMVGFLSVGMDAEGYLQNYQVYPFTVGLNRHLATAGYHMSLVECSDLVDPDDPEQPWTVREKYFDGLIVHYGLSDREARFAQNMGVPVIWWDSGVFASHGCIYRDEVEVGTQLARRLIELGHERIGYMVGQKGWQNYQAGRPQHFSYAQRFEAYKKEMKERGLKQVPIVGYDPDDVARQLKENNLTAVIQGGSDIAVLQAAALKLGWKIPRDLSIAAADREARILPRGIAVGGMLYDRCQVGEQAARMMLKLLNDGVSKIPSVRYVGEFVQGDTIVPPRKK